MIVIADDGGIGVGGGIANARASPLLTVLPLIDLLTLLLLQLLTLLVLLTRAPANRVPSGASAPRRPMSEPRVI